MADPDILEELFTDVEPSGLGARLQPLAMASAGERIAERLVTAIALGEFVPGQRLPSERDLAAMLAVSRSAVREAIGRLAAEGYVSVRRGRGGGAFVENAWGPRSAEQVRRTLLPTWRSLEQILDCRQCVEEMIAGVAARRRTSEDVAAMEAALQDYRDAGDDREASRAADESLHLAVVRATHNDYLIKLSRSLRHAVNLGFDAEPYSADLRRRALEQHAALTRAIIEQHAHDAGALAAEHFTLTESVLRGLVRRVRDDTAD